MKRPGFWALRCYRGVYRGFYNNYYFRRFPAKMGIFQWILIGILGLIWGIFFLGVNLGNFFEEMNMGTFLSSFFD